jgi:hypothetical protein
MSDQSRHKIDFVGIGFSKCGSTTLDEYLRQVRGINLPAHTKEVHYFDWYYHKGERWYQKKFKKTESGLYGEITPGYVKSPEYLHRIKDYHPSIKVILILRNPADRIYSRYKHAYQNYNNKQSLEEYIQNSGFLEKSIYIEDLLTTFEIFGRSHTHVLIFEEMVKNPENEIKKLLKFLGARVDHLTLQRLHANRSEIPANRALYKLLKKGVRWLKALNLDWVTEKVKSTGFKKMMMSKQVFSPMDEDTRKKINRVYREEIKSLSCLLDKDLNEIWKLGEKS